MTGGDLHGTSDDDDDQATLYEGNATTPCQRAQKYGC